ncbi:hypothetical protein AUQ42_15095 [Thalassospira sp. MCCC 1A02491]|nr:hypothetical protein AUQ42_15095 [Thalassospira sp. MCCC 1A02491]
MQTADHQLFLRSGALSVMCRANIGKSCGILGHEGGHGRATGVRGITDIWPGEGMAGEPEWREQGELRGPSRWQVRQVRQIQQVSGER